MIFKFFVGVLSFFLVVFTLNFFSANAGNSSTSVTIVVAQCSDGIDNDGDGLIDYPVDPGCSSAIDDDETDTSQPVSSGPAPSIIVGPGGGGFGSTPTEPIKILKLADLNGDNRVNIIDLSILLYYASKPVTSGSRYDLNNDGKIDIVDVSILFYYWA